jgi:mannobiose 2-epimerase
MKEELTGNILPFWIRHAVDKDNGGFYGAVTNDLQVRNEVPRSSILCARILWAYAAAYRTFGSEEYLIMARWALNYLTRVFQDAEFGGIYWQVDTQGKPVRDRKHHYAQAFAIYGLSEFQRATGDPQSLAFAQNLFRLLEQHACDPVNGGYLEGSSREWGALADMRLSDKEPDCRKSMNTLLHMLEGYSNLLRVWDDAELRERHRDLLRIFQQHVVDPQTRHFRLFFDDRWTSLSHAESYGHDIEGSWLLWEAAELQGETALTTGLRETVVGIADAVLRDGLDEDGSVLGEGGPNGLTDTNKSWWSQIEGMVGFYNAYQLSGDARFAEAAGRCWEYIQNRVIDREHGDWFKLLNRDGTPIHAIYKAGPWECPYHHTRGCLEMISRLDA